jgi:hypothetical protein
MSSWVQYINFLLQEKENIEGKIDGMTKAELIALSRQLSGACQQSLKGFDAWFTDFAIMEKMEAETVRDIARNLLRIGFGLLEYDRDVTKRWHDKEVLALQGENVAEGKKRSDDILV